jgi:TolA-binding protein
MKRLLLAMFGCVLFSGCLQTRESVKDSEEKQVMQKQVKNLQQMTADVSARFQDLEEDDRKIIGRVESLEHKTNQLTQKADSGDTASAQQVKQLSEKLVAYQEALTKLDQEVNELKGQVAQLQANGGAAKSSGGGSAAAEKKDAFAEAEALFKAGSFRDAILEYEKYRKANPKGKSVAESTYKIGVCFQELGMPDDARAFYDEVVSRFPKTKEANRANTRLKSLQKK